jgi:hypothetical protein
MPQTCNLPEIKIRQVCPGCGTNLPFDVIHYDFCPLWSSFYCRGSGLTRDYICIERITNRHKTSGQICEKCAFPKPQERRERE